MIRRKNNMRAKKKGRTIFRRKKETIFRHKGLSGSYEKRVRTVQSKENFSFEVRSPDFSSPYDI